jgi:DNA/RNA endonuclease YhcR with UshA esterase domain
MKKSILVSFIFTLFIFGCTNAQKKITPDEAKDNIGKKVKVIGTVEQVFHSEKVVKLNIGGTFPDNPFTAVIFAADTTAFTNLDAYQGKEVEVTGTVQEYKDKPEIILKETDQLKLH